MKRVEGRASHEGRFEVAKERAEMAEGDGERRVGKEKKSRKQK